MRDVPTAIRFVKSALKRIVDFYEESHDDRCNEAINDLHMGLDFLREE